MWTRAVVGVLLCLLGLLWIGQGFGLVRGSFMTGHMQYAVLGTILNLVGVALLVWAYRIHQRNNR